MRDLTPKEREFLFASSRGFDFASVLREKLPKSEISKEALAAISLEVIMGLRSAQSGSIDPDELIAFNDEIMDKLDPRDALIFFSICHRESHAYVVKRANQLIRDALAEEVQFGFISAFPEVEA